MARHCGHCYGRGHNRRSCPVIRKEIKDNPNGYQARIARDKKENAIRNPRRCSYCRETGHNRKTCASLTKDRRNVTQENRNWRQSFLTCAKTNGFGIGTLLKFIDPNECKSEWRRERIQNYIERYGKCGMVVDFRRGSLDKRQLNRTTQCLLVRFPLGKTFNTPLPKEFVSLIEKDAIYDMEIAGPVNSENLHHNFGPTWHDGSDTAEDFLKRH